MLRTRMQMNFIILMTTMWFCLGARIPSKDPLHVGVVYYTQLQILDATVIDIG